MRTGEDSAGYLLLEDGSRFEGELCGAPVTGTGEVVFNTAMSGYQESVTDPSYRGQIIVFTYPLIGNYGVSAAAMESDGVHARAVIMREAVNREHAPSAAGATGWPTAACRRSARSTRARSCATSATPDRCAAGSSRHRSARR
ncbi:MAG: carbamoyl-phosphate synthase small subunit, partial [Thermoleophilaceae bacterium]|nr:carbamoyl-phosphate synthase small subunit [Thermoleophilaceae bacterium]